jgi:hypothetical protein
MTVSKAERIRALLKLGHSNKTIAETVGCDDAYVRAVRQRTSRDGNPTTNPACRAWHEANPEKIKEAARAWRQANPEYWRRWYERMRNDPEKWRAYVDKQCERRNRRYHTDPEFRERVIAATARYRAKKRQQQVSA